ncbi:MAG: preQ(1) synthase [Sphingomonadaceae bacterium]
MPTKPSKELIALPNPHPDRDYDVEFSTSEFTCVCPMTGQPDFATLKISFVPDQHIVELKSLKLYLWSFRQEGHFHEDVTNLILNDLVAAIKPRRMTVVGEFNIRGGIGTVVRASYPFRVNGELARPRD